MFITLADKFNNAFLWVECDLWGGARVGNYTLSGFSPHSPCLPRDNTYCNTQTTVKLGSRE